MSAKFFLLNRKGQKIVGLADYQKKQAPGIIICHGFKGVKEEKHLEEFATKLYQAGFSVFRFDFTNNMGESFGDMEDITITQELEDLRAVVDFVHSNLNIEKNKIGLIGHSLGGMVGLLYASTDKRIKAVVPLAPVMKLDFSPALNPDLAFILKWQKQGYQTFRSRRTNSEIKVKYSFWEDGKKYDSREAIQKIKIPVLFVHGDADESVPLENTKQIYNLAKEPKKLIIVKGDDHMFSKNLNEVSSKIAEWCEGVFK